MFGYNSNDDLCYLRQVAPARFLIFYIIFIVVGVVLHWFVRNNVRRKYQSLLLDLIATFSLYGCTVGNNYVYRIYGPIWYLMVTAAVGVGHALLLCPGITANPVTHVISCIVCDNSYQKVALRLAAQLTGSLVCHPFATLLFKILTFDLGVHPLDLPMHCMSHDEERGQSVHLAMVFLMELLGTLAICLLLMMTCQKSIDIYETAAKVFIGCLLHSTGFHNPAIYLNPVLANSQLFGCSSKNVIEHVMVYWIAPVVGASVAVYSSICSQETQRKLSGPCVTFNDCPATECSQPCRLPDNKCTKCDSKSRSNSSRPCCKLSDYEDDGYPGECDEDTEPCACRPDDCGITAQVRQTAVNGSKQLAYLFDIPPSVCQKGLRLRHNILVTKKAKCNSDLCCDDWRPSTDNDWRNFSPKCWDPLPDTPPPEYWRRSCYEERDQPLVPEKSPRRKVSRPASSRQQSRENSLARQSSKKNIKVDKPTKSRSKTSKIDLWKKSSKKIIADRRNTRPERSQSKQTVRKEPSMHSGKTSKARYTASGNKESLKKGPSRLEIPSIRDLKSQLQEKQTITDSKSLAKVGLTQSQKSMINATRNKKSSTKP